MRILLAIVELSYQMGEKRQGRRGLDSWERAQRRPGPLDSGCFREGWPMQGPLLQPETRHGSHWAPLGGQVVWIDLCACCGREGRCMRELIYGVCLREENFGSPFLKTTTRNQPISPISTFISTFSNYRQEQIIKTITLRLSFPNIGASCIVSDHVHH